MCAHRLELRNALNNIHHQMKTVEVIQYDHIERRCGRAFFLVTAHVQVVMIVSPVSETMNQPRITMKRKNDWLIRREERIERLVRQSMWMRALRLQRHQIDDVHHANPQLRQSLSQN